MPSITAQYTLIKRLALYDKYVAHELSRMIIKVDVQMKDIKFGGKDPVSIMVLLKTFKTVCDTCNIREGASI